MATNNLETNGKEFGNKVWVHQACVSKFHGIHLHVKALNEMSKSDEDLICDSVEMYLHKHLQGLDFWFENCSAHFDRGATSGVALKRFREDSRILKRKKFADVLDAQEDYAMESEVVATFVEWCLDVTLSYTKLETFGCQESKGGVEPWQDSGVSGKYSSSNIF